MRRALWLLSLCLVVILAACADSEGERPADPTVASSAAPATTEVPSSTAPPTVAPTSSTTASPETTTGVPETTTTGAPPTTTTVPLVPLDELEVGLDVVADGFAAPVFVAAPPEDERIFVVDQPGIVWVIDGGDPEVFLDVRDAVTYGGERGLLGLAFSPDFASSGLFYVNYTGAGGDTRVAEFTAQGNVADPATERILVVVDQPASNHNGGMIAFGPDGYLWIGMGDGGGRNDRFGTGQDPSSLLGSMLRIDPDTSQLDDPEGFEYAIPEDNPYVDEGGAGHLAVWAIGLRNPWRFSFDGDDLWIADVGQNAWEEINAVPAATGGLNYGWPEYEGDHCYLSSSCDDSGFVAPVYEYSHSDGCSVTGGYVYRGEEIPELTGHYFFGDYCSGWVRSLAPDGGVIDWFASGTVSGLSSFGVDSSGELYVASLGGAIFRLTRRSE